MEARLMSVGQPRDEYVFKIGLLIKHPDRNLSDLADILDIAPDFVRVAGTPRMTPAGRTVGTNEEHVWSSYRVRSSKDFVAKLEQLIDQLFASRRLFDEISSTGGLSRIIIQLPGSRNVGLEFRHASARKLADLGIDLGLEVFPAF